MHVTSDHYRRRGDTRIDAALEGSRAEKPSGPPLTFSEVCPLRPSTQTIRRLYRLHATRSNLRHTA